MRRRTLPLFFLLFLLTTTLAGGAESKLLQALRRAAEEARQQLEASQSPDAEPAASPAAASPAEPGEQAGLEGAEGQASAQVLDSLLRLVSQDVGINPDEGSVQRAIWRVRVIKLNLLAARRSLDNSRQEIFGLAATGEELKTLKELDARIDEAPDSLAGDLVLEKRRLQDEAIERASRDGSLQQKKLSGDQAKRVGLLLYNLGVGVVCDNLAVRHGQDVVDDFQRVKQDLFEKGGLEAALAWVSLAAYHREFLAVPADLGTILTEIPSQLGALGAMIGTIKVLKENNAIEEREAKPGDRFETIEDF